MISSIIPLVIGTGTSPPSGLATVDGPHGGDPSSVLPLCPACQSCWNTRIPCGSTARISLA
jgi:hypothetical protein